MRYLLGLLTIVFLVGCMTVRTYEIEKPRIDTDIEGNRGFLSGEPKVEAKESKLGPTRKVSVVEIEFDSSKNKDLPKAEVTAQQLFVEKKPVSSGQKNIKINFSEKERSPAEAYSWYIVKKNDTLQKISDQFYGTTRKWQSIYEANKDVLKSPDKLSPGLKIKIPNL